MKEGKSMEKDTGTNNQSYLPLKNPSMEKAAKWYAENSPTMQLTIFDREKLAFIAGWQEQDKEIERLKGLLEETFIDYCIQKYARLGIPLDKDDKEKMWNQFKTENHL